MNTFSFSGSLRRRFMLFVPLFASAVPLCCAQSASAAATGTRSFVVTYFWNAFSPAANDCPEGLNPPPDKEIAISRLPPEKRDEYRSNDQKVLRIISKRGPKGENVCEDPTAVPDPGFRVAQGGIQEGMNLKGPGGPPSNQICEHVELRNPSGETSVDNQLSRVMACVQHRRADGFFPKYFVNQMRSGEFAYLIEVTGIDDSRTEGDVQVGLYASADPIVLDSNGRPLSHASLQVTNDAHYQHILKGRIKDGVVLTEAADILLPLGSVFQKLELRNAKLRLTLHEDGSAEGLLDGYQDWRAYYASNASAGGIAETSGGPFQCPGLFNALKHAADAYPDPKTSECTSISAAYKIEAIHAYVIHPKGATAQTAQATSPAASAPRP
jgi:hypothetical protein